jgi:hypothetical protein
MINSFINNAATCGVIQEIIAKSNVSETEMVSYLEPFMENGSITPVEDENNKSLMARLTPSAKFLPSATAEKVCVFINLCRHIRTMSMILLGEVESELKNSISFIFKRYTNSDEWHKVRNNFQRNDNGKSENYFKKFHGLFSQKFANFYGNAEGNSADEVIHYGLSFTDLSKAFYWFGDSLLNAKIEVSKTFGILKPDVFSFGLRVISEDLRNKDAHLLASYRFFKDQKFSDKSRSAMANPWISTKCNLGRFYGRMCFLVYITTDFANNYCPFARKEIKALMLQMPKMTVNYLGLHSNWFNEPLWSNI